MGACKSRARVDGQRTAEASVEAGYVLQRDADETIAAAERSTVGVFQGTVTLGFALPGDAGLK